MSSSERTGEAQQSLVRHREFGPSGLSSKTAMDHDGGTSNIVAYSSRMFQVFYFIIWSLTSFYPKMVFALLEQSQSRTGLL